MADKELILKIKSEYKDVGLKDLKTELKSVQTEMDNLKKSNQQNSAEWNTLKTRAGVLNTEIKSLTREFKGMEGQVKMSKFALLEMGENMTVVAAGITALIGKIVHVVKELAEIGLHGAEVDEMRKHFEKLNGGVEDSALKFELLKKASSGNLNDEELLKYVNKLDELNYTTEQSTQILDLATTKHHELGVSIEDATTKITRFLETGRGKGLFQLGISISDVTKKMVEMSGMNEKEIAQLDTENQQSIRKLAFMELYANKLDDIKNKEKNNADMIVSVGVAWENLKTSIGKIIAEGLVPFIQIGEKVIERIKEVIFELIGGKDKIEDFKNGVIKLIKEGLEYLYNIFVNQIIPAYKELVKAIREYIDENPEMISGLKIVGGLFAQMASHNFTRILGIMTKILWFLDKIKYLAPPYWFMKLYGLTDNDSKESTSTYKDAEGGTSTWQDAEGGIIKENTGETSKGSKNNNTKTEKELEEWEKLIKSIQFALEYDKEFHNLTTDNLRLYSEQLKVYLQLVDTDEKRLKIQKEINTVNSEYWKRLKFDKDKTFSSDINTTDTSISDRGYKPYKTESKNDGIENVKKLFDSAVESVTSIKSIFENLMTGLGIATDSFIGKLIGGFNTLLSLIQTIVATIQMVSTVKSFLGTLLSFIPGGGALGAMADGGLFSGYGTGTSDSNIVRLSNGEFIVNAESTRKNLSLLQAINGNVPSYNYGKYANGGIVKNSLGINPNITVIVNSAIEKSKAVRVLNGLSKEVSVFNSKKTVG